MIWRRIIRPDASYVCSIKTAILSNERSGKSRNLIKEALSCTKSAEAVTDYGTIYSRFAVGIHVGRNFSLVTAET